ncbi:MAG: alpha/beta fold hydrolase, partial [Janthinobacterium lividum]
LEAMVLISSAPDRGWEPAYEAMTRTYPLAEAIEAARRYEARPSDQNLRELTVASAAWIFTSDSLDRGRELLGRLPYNSAAFEWDAAHADQSRLAAWWPVSLPTLIISGTEDRIVDQDLWDDPYYQGDHVQHVRIDDAGHLPWIDQPQAVGDAFAAFGAALDGDEGRPGPSLPDPS